MNPMDAAWAVLKADPSRSLMMSTSRLRPRGQKESFRVAQAHPALSPETVANIEGVGVHVPEAMYYGDTRSPSNRMLTIGQTYPSDYDMSFDLEGMNDRAAAFDQHYNLLPRAQGEVQKPIRIGQSIEYGDKYGQSLPRVLRPSTIQSDLFNPERNTFAQEHALSGYPMDIVDIPGEFDEGYDYSTGFPRRFQQPARGYVSTQPVRQNTGMPPDLQPVQGSIMDVM